MDKFFIHSLVCITIGPQTLPKGVLQKVRSRDSSFNLQQPLVYFRPSGSCLRLLLRLSVASILPFYIPSAIFLRRQILRKMCLIQSASLLFTANCFVARRRIPQMRSVNNLIGIIERICLLIYCIFVNARCNIKFEESHIFLCFRKVTIQE